jgi:hypothetical protein
VSNPWLGLASFTEETRAYFFGRDEEIAELARRVQRKLLTLLFGQSGLGKTSILRAGLVPRLRGQGYCPIYVRIAYHPDTPDPAEQIKRAIIASARRSGEWTQTGVAVEGESLWEFLHHRDDVLRDESGNTLIPLLIFDQFEEIFTLAQSDDFGRERAVRLISEIGDLVENRPPKALAVRIDEDDSVAARFDFSRSDYRVLIALREDYLAPLEGLKQDIPSIAQNRLRLAPMTGTQALAAVLQPGKGLISEEAAAAIVRFVAGGAELANAVVEPSLLSLICRELNDARIAQGRAEISLDLLAGSHATILQNFYERVLADQPVAVRRVIEDDLLTDSGFRENVAEERLVSRLAEAGAAPETLTVLVNRRLLRIEERLDVRRVELTHDVLCGVVKASRDQRQEREARENTERMLAGQRERELLARRAAARARRVAAACTVLALVAVAAAAFGYISSQRARRAERGAQETRALADQARGQAEHLLGYLSDDLARDLEAFGRLDVLAEFSQRQIDYFHALPAVLRGTETTRNAALALVYHARALRSLGNIKDAAGNATEALQLLELLQAGADHSEATVIALALANSTQARVLESQNDPRDLASSEKAAALLRPLAATPKPSVAVQRAYVEVLTRLGFEQYRAQKEEDGIHSEEEARRIAADLGARDITSLDMAAYYAEAGAWMVEALTELGRNDEALRVGQEAVEVADKVLARRPGYRLALHAQGITLDNLASIEQDNLDPKAALPFSQSAEQVALTLMNLDPGNVVSMNNLGVAHTRLADLAWSAGRLREALRYRLQSLEDYRGATVGGTLFHLTYVSNVAPAVYYETEIGDFAQSEATTAALIPALDRLRKTEAAGSFVTVAAEASLQLAHAVVAFERDDFATARRIATDIGSQFAAMKPSAGVEGNTRRAFIWVSTHYLVAPAAYELGDFAAAEQASRTSIDDNQIYARVLSGRRDLANATTLLAMAQARQGKLAQASRTIAPVLTFERGLAARNRGDEWIPVELAGALYAAALSDPAKRAALLTEAAASLSQLSPEMNQVHEVRRWRTRIRQAPQH